MNFYSAEAGLCFKLKPGLNLYTGVYADYGITDLQKTGNTANLVSYDPEGIVNTNANGVLANDTFIDKSKLFAAGIQMKLGFSLRKKHRLPESEGVRKEQVIKERATEPEEQVESVETVKTETSGPMLNKEEVEVITRPISFGGINNVSVTDELGSRLDHIARLLTKYRALDVLISGYTCDLGSKELNRRIGQQRADAVADYLRARGIASKRMDVESKGETVPLVPNTSEMNRKKNRRVTITIKE